MTGAPIPEGTAAVVPVEKTELVDERTVKIDWIDPPAGAHIMQQGSSIQVGQQVIARGTTLRAIEIAILAEVGCPIVDVFPRPRVAVLATGNELTAVDQRPDPGKIRNSGGPMLTAAVAEAGALSTELPVARDDLDQLTRLVQQGLEADVLVVTGGVSAGVKDLVPAALGQAGVRKVLHKVSIKPGKPVWFGVVERTNALPKLVFGLPGNPVSGLVCFQLFVRPALDVLAGRETQVALRLVCGLMADSYEHRGGRETFRPARCVASSDTTCPLPLVEITPWQGSADLAGLAHANCLLHLPADPMRLAPGQEVEYLPLG
jgi:molybdopterin molybdotransferase